MSNKIHDQKIPTKYFRKCHSCLCTIYYKSKSSLNWATKNNSKCTICYRKQQKEHAQTKEYKDKLSAISSGKNNPMSGKTYYQIWVKKYGLDKAKQLVEEKRKKDSIRSSGKNNNMYGKPSPQGSGNGWSGWYKDHFFRSILELSYMVYLDSKNISWRTGENAEFKIQYIDYDGQFRNYFPDFIIKNRIMVECKPKRLHNTPKVVAKTNAAKCFCEKNGYKFRLIDNKKLSEAQMVQLYKDKIISFTDRYEEKFKNRYLNKLGN